MAKIQKVKEVVRRGVRIRKTVTITTKKVSPNKK